MKEFDLQPDENSGRVSTTAKFKLNDKRKISFYWVCAIHNFANLIESKQ